MKKIYLSGPMRGHAEFNFPAFEHASRIIRINKPEDKLVSPHELDCQIEDIGRFDPNNFNPETNVDVKNHLTSVLKRDAELVLDSDLVLTMDGWEQSKGAVAEVMLARAAGIEHMQWEQYIYSDVPNKVALCGNKGVGKSTFAHKVFGEHMKWSFAQPLRDMLNHLPLPEHALTHDKEEPIEFLGGVTGRKLLQTLGTDWGRELFPPIWVECMRHKIKMHIYDSVRGLPVRGIVVDDLRFDNEAEMLQMEGFQIWKIIRHNFTPNEDSHVSEAGISSSLIDKTVEL